MGVSQVNQSFQNDGNFSQIDLLDVRFGGPIMRLENFRCSQPVGAYGTTASGTSVTTLAGNDHLVQSSNKTFRHIFSYGQLNEIIALLEIRETYEEDGSLSCYIRDLDGRSDSFGFTYVSSVKPTRQAITVNCKILESGNVQKKILTSPYETPVAQQVEGLVDIADIELQHTVGEIAIDLSVTGDNSAALSKLGEFGSWVQNKYPRWSQNVQIYQRMGNFRDKRIHPGTNLVGKNPRLASEYILASNYRIGLIMGGRIFDPHMIAGVSKINIGEPLALDAKPGVFTMFISAFATNIGLYQLGIDKTHSDYGGVPMTLRPGSRLETAATPLVDSTNLNRILALLAAFFYAPDALPSLIHAKPQVLSFGVRSAFPVLD